MLPLPRLLARAPRPRLVAALAIVALVAGASVGTHRSGPSTETELAADPVDRALAAPSSLAVPSGRAPAPAPDPGRLTPPSDTGDSTDTAGDDGERDELPKKVKRNEPDVVVRPKRHAPDLSDAMDVKGVRHLAPATEFRATTPVRRDELKGKAARDGRDDGEGRRQVGLDVLAVDGKSFRSMTPKVTANERAVWERLDDGDVLVRHDVASRLGIELGSRIMLETDAGQQPVRVGAFASNGAPPLADVVVPREVATLLGEYGTNTLIVAADKGADAKKVGRRVLDTIGKGKVDVRERPERERAPAKQSAPSGAGVGGPTTIEPFTYTDLGDGMIEIDPAWVNQWIAPVTIPGMGTTRCHRTMIPQLLGALQELQQRGLYGELDPAQFGGCWVPRHIDFLPERPISQHAWGLAIDFNVQTNGLGETPTMDMKVVRVFERWGFEWGGWWSRPDGMHFELDRIVRR